MAILPSINGVEQRLDRLQATMEELLAELRALRSDARPQSPPEGTTTLREPAKRGRPVKAGEGK